MPTGVLRPLASCAAMQPAPDAHPTPSPGWQRVLWHEGAPPKPAGGGWMAKYGAPRGGPGDKPGENTSDDGERKLEL